MLTHPLRSAARRLVGLFVPLLVAAPLLAEETGP